MVDDETALRRYCYDHPEDDAGWLVLADWLRDHGRDHQADNVPLQRRIFRDCHAWRLECERSDPPDGDAE